MTSILIVDDEPTIRLSLTRFFGPKGFEVDEAENGTRALEKIERRAPDVLLLDVRMPDMDGVEVLRRVRTAAVDSVVVMMSAHADVEKAVAAMKEGATDFLIKPVDLERLDVAVAKAAELAALRRQNRMLRDRIERVEAGGDPILGESDAMAQITRLIGILAQNPATTVLITGESGTGKGMVAERIHRQSARVDQPFLEINCAGLSESFLESELFGHEKGAYTDAKEMKRGLLEVAHGGSLFLDEIGDLALPLQPKLLRVLETRRFRRLGGVRDIEVDVRIIAATNRDLAAEMQKGRFREDLFYRLNVMPIHMPPLRDRRDDILYVAAGFVRDFNRLLRRNVTGISAEARQVLMSYPWPGNVRELRNIVERAMILCTEGEIRVEHLPEELNAHRMRGGDASGSLRSLDEMERLHIEEVLRALAGNRSRASRTLGISRSTLIEKIKRYRIAS